MISVAESFACEVWMGRSFAEASPSAPPRNRVLWGGLLRLLRRCTVAFAARVLIWTSSWAEILDANDTASRWGWANWIRWSIVH